MVTADGDDLVLADGDAAPRRFQMRWPPACPTR